jgi:hypothetical protein
MRTERAATHPSTSAPPRVAARRVSNTDKARERQVSLSLSLAGDLVRASAILGGKEVLRSQH